MRGCKCANLGGSQESIPDLINSLLSHSSHSSPRQEKWRGLACASVAFRRASHWIEPSGKANSACALQLIFICSFLMAQNADTAPSEPSQKAHGAELPTSQHLPSTWRIPFCDTSKQFSLRMAQQIVARPCVSMHPLQWTAPGRALRSNTRFGNPWWLALAGLSLHPRSSAEMCHIILFGCN